jgi:hypothetical protein
MRQKKKIKKTVKKSKKIKNKGVDHCFAGTLRNSRPRSYLPHLNQAH